MTEMTLDYDDLGAEEKVVHKWETPELQIHHDVLKACGAKRFRKTYYKRDLTALAEAIERGAALGDDVYAVCLNGLSTNSDGQIQEPLPPIPPSWVPWRLKWAKEHRWSVAGTVAALYDCKTLRKHCEYHLR